MRKDGVGDLPLRAVGGTHVVLMAWDLGSADRQHLLGFSIKRQAGNQPEKVLQGLKYFKSLVPSPVMGATYPSTQHPFQTLLWADYEAEPGTTYQFTVEALYGTPGALVAKHQSTVAVTTETENDGKHGIWFNRGAIASHALASQFKNRQVTDAIANQVDTQGLISDPEARWLSRGLADAAITFINEAKPGEALRVCAYEFTWPPVLNALKRALDRGVDVRIVYHFTKKPKDPNAKAIAAAKLPARRGNNQVLFQRTRTQIPHNKFIVKVQDGAARQVWTGSTNFTSTGFLGQTNVGHLVSDPSIASTYLRFWEELSSDPVHSDAVANAVALSPNPPCAIARNSIEPFYSPRIAQNMLSWYADRIDDTAALAMMTIPFNVDATILSGLAKPRDPLRLVILEMPPTQDVLDAQTRNKGKLLFSNGAIVGKQFIRNPRGGGKVTPIPHSMVDKWFIDEELARPVNNGHVFFMHAKVLLIDPLANDPLVCSGSANFSKNSLLANDENMLLIRGETRVADIYLTEFDRIFRHFYARDAINRFAQQGNQTNPLELDETAKWVAEYFHPGGYKNNRRLLFFPDPRAPRLPAWPDAAAKDPNAFANEQQLAAQNRKKKSASKSTAAKKSSKKDPATRIRVKAKKRRPSRGKGAKRRAKKK